MQSLNCGAVWVIPPVSLCHLPQLRVETVQFVVATSWTAEKHVGWRRQISAEATRRAV